MVTPTDEQTVQRSVTVQVPVDQAFAVFTEGLAEWWPQEYTYAGDGSATPVMERKEGGRWFERDRGGNETDWGRVLVWDPPQRLALTWQVSPRRTPEPDPSHASEIEVRFTAERPQATRVELEHRHFDRHSEGGGEQMRAGMASPAGWIRILAHYVVAAR